jgi:murein L,D-transpeptidase YafK
MVRYIYIISILGILVIIGIFAWPRIMGKFEPPIDFDRVDVRYWEFLNSHEISDPIQDVNIVITKNNRMLYLLSGDTFIERWRIALGRDPEGAKTEVDDGRTPVGDYTICTHDVDTDYHLFLWITYPGTHDADAGLREGLIDEREYHEISRLVNQSFMPLQDTALGGGIGIHGGDASRDWTDGSIAVKDEVVEILWDACPDGTPVVIYEDFEDWELADRMLSHR